MHRVLAALLIVVHAADATAEVPGVHSFTLGNGLTAVVIEDHRAPVVTEMVWYRVGSAEDPPGRAGLAHFLEHLMFKATDTLAEGEYDSVIRANGGSNNAFTTIDSTTFIARIAADRLDLVMGMEADRLVNLALAEKSVLAERDVVIEERRQVVDGDPAGRFREQLFAAFYPDSPVGRPTIGSEREIASLTRADALAFYDAHYAPNNAILIVAGDVGVDAVRALAERHFGPIPASPVASRAPRPLTPPAPTRIVAEDARLPLPEFVRLYPAPARRPGDQREAAALTVLADLLGGERVTAVMSRELAGADGIALGAYAFYSDTGVGGQNFGLSLSPKPGVDPAEAEAALDALIARFLAAGPDPGEIARMRNRARAAEIYQLDDVPGRANLVGERQAADQRLADVEAWPGLVQAVTAEDVAAAARDVLRSDNAVTGWLMPAGAAPPGDGR